MKIPHKTCKHCGKSLIRKVWEGKRKYIERLKRFNERMFCDNICRSKNLSITSKGKNNYFYGKNITPWNKGNKQERIVINPSKSYTRVFYLEEDGGYRFVYEHREIVEENIGRKLDSSEIIHHIDENIKNNSVENLLITSRSEHRKLHAKAR